MDKEKQNELEELIVNLVDGINLSDTADPKNKEKINRMREIARELAEDRTRPTLTIKQINMPDDWKKQLLDAKVDHDKHGSITLTFVLPLFWLNSFKEKVENDDLINFYNKDRRWLWGAEVMFGPVDRPIAAGNW